MFRPLPIVSALLLAACPLAGQVMVTLAPNADTFVQETQPTSNYGTSGDLLLGRGVAWGLGNVRGLVRFDLVGLPADARRVREARLKLWQHGTEPATGGLDCEVHACTSAWAEGSATWTTMPGFDPRVRSSASVGDSAYTGWIEWDVTELVRDQVAGTVANEGWLFKVANEQSGPSRLGYFHSRESTTFTVRPKLEVDTYALLLDTTPFIAGSQTTATVSGAGARAIVAIFASTAGLGTTVVPQLGIELELLSPQLVVAGRADLAGNYTVSRRIPLALSGASGWVQAASYARLSNKIEVSVP